MTPLRLVIGFIGIVLVLCVIGIILLAYDNQPIPDVLQNIGVGALTALGALLVPTRTSDRAA